MAEGRRSANWDHTAAIMHQVACVNRTEKSRVPKYSDFHPFLQGMKAAAKDVAKVSGTEFVACLAAALNAKKV